MPKVRVVTVCVGSSCHIKGSREVIKQFNELLKQYRLEDVIELKGSFCMERCGKGVNWKIDEEPYTSPDVDDAVRVFKEKVIAPYVPAEGGGKT
jgi:NADH:ubiquinone oxidoreductase subunit E